MTPTLNDQDRTEREGHPVWFSTNGPVAVPFCTRRWVLWIGPKDLHGGRLGLGVVPHLRHTEVTLTYTLSIIQQSQSDGLWTLTPVRKGFCWQPFS